MLLAIIECGMKETPIFCLNLNLKGYATIIYHHMIRYNLKSWLSAGTFFLGGGGGGKIIGHYFLNNRLLFLFFFILFFVVENIKGLRSFRG